MHYDLLIPQAPLPIPPIPKKDPMPVGKAARLFPAIQPGRKLMAVRPKSENAEAS